MSCLAKITDKNTTQIPKEICESLKLKVGDSIVFQILDTNIVIIKKADSTKDEYLTSLESTLDEWQSKQDEEDFEHLQDL